MKRGDIVFVPRNWRLMFRIDQAGIEVIELKNYEDYH